MYVILEFLKYYVSQGLQVTKIHNILQFTQAAWMIILTLILACEL